MSIFLKDVVICNKNEIFKNCEPSCGGDNTCDRPFKTNLHCPPACIQGCFCIPGHVRNSEGQCIPIGDCPTPTCRENEEFNECGCVDKNCENRDDNIVCVSCQRGCYCKPGFVRSSDDKCIPVNECPSCNQPNEKYTFCNKLCEPTCKSPRPEICPAICFPGCVCQEGFVRDDNGNCVKFEQCPKTECCLGEVFSPCGSNGCQATCENPDLPTRCRGNCEPGCVCMAGTIRNKDNKCVPIDDCPIKDC